MKPKKEDPSASASIRVMGQHSIPSSFFLRSSVLDRSTDINQEEEVTTNDAPPNNNSNNNYSRVSLSDFLDRKLRKASLLPKTFQEKEMLFSSRVNHGDCSGSILGKIGVNNGRETEVKSVLKEAVFKQFNYDKIEKEDFLGSCNSGEFRSSDTDGVLSESGKGRNPFKGGDEKVSTLKHVVVIGADPKLKEKRREESFISNKKLRPTYNHCGDEIASTLKHVVVPGADTKPKQKRMEESFSNNKKSRPIYNHYANGSGWWDCNMEGLDSDVGCSEVWEGMGSTTLGGLEWH